MSIRGWQLNGDAQSRNPSVGEAYVRTRADDDVMVMTAISTVRNELASVTYSVGQRRKRKNEIEDLA
jgi:hypothetical protein